MIIKPQKGKQEQFLSSKADIVFYGGAVVVVNLCCTNRAIKTHK